MQAGDATILLRTEHVPPAGLTSELRRVRIARHAPSPAPALDPSPAPDSVKLEPAEGDAAPWHLRRLLELGPRLPGAEVAPAPPPGADGSSSEEEGRSLAAAFFARAVLLCRAELYPGLHTILAPPPPAAPHAEEAGAECAWCLRLWGARRCLWYGPPRRTPLAERAWRREGARRFLCSCCGEAGDEAPAPEETRDADGGGWYGKGYRKGRRRR